MSQTKPLSTQEVADAIYELLSECGGSCPSNQLTVKLTQKMQRLIYASSILPALQLLHKKVGVINHHVMQKGELIERQTVYQL